MEQAFLTPDEIRILTGRIRHKSQLEALAKEGIPATRDADGKPIVYRKTYEALHLEQKKQRTIRPNLDAI